MLLWTVVMHTIEVDSWVEPSDLPDEYVNTFNSYFIHFIWMPCGCQVYKLRAMV